MHNSNFVHVPFIIKKMQLVFRLVCKFPKLSIFFVSLNQLVTPVMAVAVSF